MVAGRTRAEGASMRGERREEEKRNGGVGGGGEGGGECGDVGNVVIDTSYDGGEFLEE
jgi:hypothetical protein